MLPYLAVAVEEAEVAVDSTLLHLETLFLAVAVAAVAQVAMLLA
jgi:hypothetical protein